MARRELLRAEERAALQAAGARIAFVPVVPGRSTTRLVTAMRRSHS